MAQLVKLLDYVSRYEHDLSRYPTQYIRLKRYQWDRMKVKWENGVDLAELQRGIEEEPDEPEEGRWFTPLFRLFGQRKTVIEEMGIPKAVDQEDGHDFGFPSEYHLQSEKP